MISLKRGFGIFEREILVINWTFKSQAPPSYPVPLTTMAIKDFIAACYL